MRILWVVSFQLVCHLLANKKGTQTSWNVGENKRNKNFSLLYFFPTNERSHKKLNSFERYSVLHSLLLTDNANPSIAWNRVKVAGTKRSTWKGMREPFECPLRMGNRYEFLLFMLSAAAARQLLPAEEEKLSSPPDDNTFSRDTKGLLLCKGRENLLCCLFFARWWKFWILLRHSSAPSHHASETPIEPFFLPHTIRQNENREREKI